MPINKDREAVIQNLKDAGCKESFAEDFLVCYDRKEKQLKFLEDWRENLQQQVYKEEKKISCLDYLIHRLQKVQELQDETEETAMNTERFIQAMDSGERVPAGSPVHQQMVKLSNEAMRITGRLNRGYHEPEEIREIMEELTGKEIDSTFGMFPPFYTDCGKNLHIGKHVFINSGCQFQDQGGIHIGDGTLIGPSVVLATLNHDLDPKQRADIYPKPIHIGKMCGLALMRQCCRELRLGMAQ